MKIPSHRRIRLAAAALLAGLALAAGAPRARADVEMPPAIVPLYQGGHYSQAVEVLEADIGRAPKDASLHFWLGRCFFELRDFGHAISSFEHAVSIEPGNSEYHHWLGIASGRKAEESNPFTAFTLAFRTHQEFETAVRLDRSNLGAQRDLIRYLLSAPSPLGGGDDAALKQMADLALVDPVQADLARAEYFIARKKLDQAREQYREILASKPANAGVYLEIAEFYRDHGDAAAMQQAVDGAAKADPSDLRLEYYRGVALVLGKGNPAAAENDLRAYLATVPPNSDFASPASAHEWLGKLYENEGRTDAADMEYQTALSGDPHNKDLREAVKRVEGK